MLTESFLYQLTRLEDLHDRGYLHRDLKPENILLHDRTCYLVDFGFTKRYCHPKTREHLPAKSGKGALGTPRYASLNVHLGREPSRRDDLESLAYVMIYLLKGHLPWQGLPEKSDGIWREVYAVKSVTSIESICQWLQPEFADFLRYTRNLDFTEKPDYTRWRAVLKDLSTRMYPTNLYQWTAPPRPTGGWE